MCKNLSNKRMSLEEYIEKEYESEYANKEIDMGYLSDSELDYDAPTLREKYWDMEIDRWYK